MPGGLSMNRNQEKEEFFKFLETKCDTTDAPLKLTQIARDFVSTTKSETEPEVLRTFVPEFRERVWEIPDRNKMVRRIFGLNIPCGSHQQKKLQKQAKVEFSKKRIVYYWARDGTLTLMNRAVLLPDGNKKLFNEFLSEKCKKTRHTLAKKDLMEEYLALHHRPCLTTLNNWFDDYRKEVGRMPGLDQKTRIKQLFVLGARISSQLFSELKKDANVERNKNRTIKKFISKDGKIRFENFHCFTDEIEEEEEEEEEEDTLQDDPVDPIPPAPKRPRTTSDTAGPSTQSAQAAPKRRKTREHTVPPPAQQVKVEVVSDEEEDVKPDVRNLPNMQVELIKTENPEIQEEMEPEVHQE